MISSTKGKCNEENKWDSHVNDKHHADDTGYIYI